MEGLQSKWHDIPPALLPANDPSSRARGLKLFQQRTARAGVRAGPAATENQILAKCDRLGAKCWLKVPMGQPPRRG